MGELACKNTNLAKSDEGRNYIKCIAIFNSEYKVEGYFEKSNTFQINNFFFSLFQAANPNHTREQVAQKA